MAAWGYEFYLLVLKALEDKIRIPARPCNILCFLTAWIGLHDLSESMIDD